MSVSVSWGPFFSACFPWNDSIRATWELLETQTLGPHDGSPHEKRGRWRPASSAFQALQVILIAINV